MTSWFNSRFKPQAFGLEIEIKQSAAKGESEIKQPDIKNIVEVNEREKTIAEKYIFPTITVLSLIVTAVATWVISMYSSEQIDLAHKQNEIISLQTEYTEKLNQIYEDYYRPYILPIEVQANSNEQNGFDYGIKLKNYGQVPAIIESVQSRLYVKDIDITAKLRGRDLSFKAFDHILGAGQETLCCFIRGDKIGFKKLINIIIEEQQDHIVLKHQTIFRAISDKNPSRYMLDYHLRLNINGGVPALNGGVIKSEISKLE